MGRDLVAVALAIVSTKDPEHFRTTPGGYFHGMVQKAKAGELHLDRTVWALRRAAEPATGAAKRAGEGAAAKLTSRRRLADGGASAILMRRGDRSVR